MASGGVSAASRADIEKGIAMTAALCCLALAVAVLSVPPLGLARDTSQWEATDATVRAWYRELM
jgi:hypothetical protein